MYEYDKSKLIKGDCLIEMTNIKDKSIDMILCDLPYGSTCCDWDIIIPFKDLWKQYSRIIKDNGAILLFGAEPFSSRLRLSNIDNYKYDWIWDKIKGTGFLNAKKQPMRNHELISVFYKKQCIFNPQKTYGHEKKESYRSGDMQTDVYGKMKNNYTYSSTERYPRSIQIFSTDTQNTSLHPTQKPVNLLRYFIFTYTNKGDTVLDNCMGSGSTGIACLETKRNFIGIEKDPDIYKTAETRIKIYRRQQKLF